MKDAGDVVGIGDDVDDAHPSAALATDGDVDCEDTGEQMGPAETAGARGRLGGGVVLARVGEVERERELLPLGRDETRRNDASAQMMAIRKRAGG